MKVLFALRMLLLVSSLVFLNQCLLAQTSMDNATKERLTIRWVAKALERMGEKTIAQRLVRDYHQNGRVNFGVIHPQRGNAETGANRRGVNEITFSTEMLKVGESDRLLNKKPYGGGSTLILWALTVVHEYQHMDQRNPQNQPPWEDPAWRVTDQTIVRWSKLLEAEYNAALKQKSSKEKDAKIAEIAEIVTRLRSEIGNTREAINGNVANGSLSPNLNWTLDESHARLSAILKAMEKRKAVGLLAPPKPQTDKRAGVWVLVEEKAFDYLPPGTNNYSLTASNGSISSAWWMADDAFRFTSKWTVPPKQIGPKDRIKIDMSITITQNSGDAYSANGNFDIWFDRPECEPGSVIAPISLKGANGVTGSLAVSHRLSAPVPQPISVFIDGAALPTGSKGARIALMVCAYNGRAAGYRYIYEWKDPFQ